MRKPNKLTMMVSAPIKKEEIKPSQEYKEPIGTVNPYTPEMQALKKNDSKIETKNETPVEPKTEEKEISKIESIKKLAQNRKQTPPLMSLSCLPIQAEEIKPLTKYKEPKTQVVKETPEMAKLKKLPKTRKRKRLFVVKQTRSKPPHKIRPKKQQLFCQTKKIQAL
jgi:hypothetical protein